MVRVLITGATGFIGSHLARACLDRGDAVAVIARPDSSMERLADIEGQLDFHRLELTQPGSLRRCFAATRPERVFHAGARTRFDAQDDLGDMADSVDENLIPLIALLSAAAAADPPPKAFIRAGTIAEYGDISTPYVETARENPRNAYGASFLAGTHFMTMAQSRLPFRAVTARLALTYGPGQSQSFLIPQMIAKLLDGRPVEIRRPQDRRDLIHVDDVVRGLLRIAEEPDAAGSLVNLCSGVAPRVAEIARMLVELTDATPDLVRIEQTDHAPVELVCSPAHIRDSLGWSPQIPLPDGLERTVKWVRENTATPTLQTNTMVPA
ncbi:NAD-dependent epimerase/dehydratase family protein [Aliiruegeria lutimaris]|uniref:Nucleoside-diphosphate-sugar epimerase n=1 Tax=Aliiruegeria lutimaris TaxID=571298 RepID=A0A1G9FS43_9RHOB|nr:NAD(P)-dependent oxidoreductase [Aliiruegeria lutimaris]SDK91246.1 Nucleoside-diphosphate-sugar epimerase [Aliiruegeria lutimaris]